MAAIELTPDELESKKRHGYWLRCDDGIERVLHLENGVTVLTPFTITTEHNPPEEET